MCIHTYTHIKSGNFWPKEWIANRFVAFENLSKGNNIISDQQNLRQKWDPLSVNHNYRFIYLEPQIEVICSLQIPAWGKLLTKFGQLCSRLAVSGIRNSFALFSQLSYSFNMTRHEN